MTVLRLIHSWSNICLVGGNTMISGIHSRLRKELLGLAPPSKKLSVVMVYERKITTWVGGSILGMLRALKRFYH